MLLGECMRVQVRVDRLELRPLRAGPTAAGDYTLAVGADNLVAPKHHRPSEMTVADGAI